MKHPTPILLTLIGLLLAGRIWTLTPAIQPAPAADPQAPGEPAPARPPDEVQALFTGLTAAGLLRPGPDATLDLPPEDLALVAAWRHAPLPPEQARLIADLYRGQAGAALRGQVQQWNQTRRVSAVRDDGRTLWRAYRCADHRLLATGAPVPETFGYLHQGRLQTDLGDWTAVATRADCIDWHGERRADRPEPLRILYLGRPLADPGGTLTPINPGPAKTAPPACLDPPPADQAGQWLPADDAWRPEPDGTFTLQLRLRLAPAHNPGLAAPGLRVGVDNDCRVAWQPAPADPGLPPARWQIETADGQALLDAAARPTAAAEALGLTPIVGFGPHDHHGLGRRLAGLHPAGRLRLTIDGRLQAAARRALGDGLARLGQTDPDANDRRAVLVLLDLDGAIRAAAARPEPPPAAHINPWDLAAFARVYPLADPRLARAWEGGDRHTQPGSTLKTVTALAGLAGAGHDPAIAGLLDGLSPTDFQRQTGLGLDATEIDPLAGRPNPSGEHRPRLKNFRLDNGRYETLGDLRRGALSQGCPGQPPGRGDLGLASALRDSLNIWFAALALQLDGPAADRFSDDPRPLAARSLPGLHLSAMLRRLGVGEPTPLLAAEPRQAARMETDRPDLFALGKGPMEPRWVLAQTAIGQGIQTTPLRMAAIAAAIARGAPVRPHLDARWNDRPVPPPPAEPLGLDLTALHRGLAAVVQTGTAKQAFRRTPSAIRCRTRAKTGTAQIARADGSGRLEPYTSAWLIGWHDPAPGSPPPLDRPLAFACLVTHADAPGGAVCGPIVAELLRALYASSRPATAAD